jgi:hypothetical protein
MDYKHIRTAPADALVIFGVTGDLAHKMIFPALYALVKRGLLNVPVVGVASSKLTMAQLRKRVRDSIRQAGRIDDRAALDHLLSLLRYVSGNYNDPGTFSVLKQALGAAKRPAHYLAIPPALFATVINNLGESGLAKQARVIVEKPFGRDLASARELNRIALSVFAEDAIFRIGDHEYPLFPFRQFLPRTDLEPRQRGQRADHAGRGFRRKGSRRVLRKCRLPARRHSEPPVSARRVAGHGATRVSKLHCSA